MTIATVEGDEIVIRFPVTAISCQPEPRRFLVTDVAALVLHVAREIGDEDTGERPWIEPLVEAAIIRAAECDAPDIKWDDASAEDRALHEAENDHST
ncbi:hypothetical protein [Phaeobacter piscinae]|uniref:hypothetical protein n=1 Tax=Phaeobacter piscinae TaxID=1580596 RepID=UPI00058DB0D9|nr:hypothetical protein [Phaeobacter piscinae]UTS79624.1 hypothetical protein OL67_000672 [Phaeobacter piscinae]